MLDRVTRELCLPAQTSWCINSYGFCRAFPYGQISHGITHVSEASWAELFLEKLSFSFALKI